MGGDSRIELPEEGAERLGDTDVDRWWLAPRSPK